MSRRPRNFTIFSLFSFGGGYMMLKSRALAEKQKQRAAGDYSVTVDRSGELAPCSNRETLFSDAWVCSAAIPGPFLLIAQSYCRVIPNSFGLFHSAFTIVMSSANVSSQEVASEPTISPLQALQLDGLPRSLLCAEYMVVICFSQQNSYVLLLFTNTFWGL
ncbi:hypothetical protein BCR34DRAFT_475840 [Clohesyomyces aquaticus]|uniref:Uncharacterized protein n=1 Tax=Clohesyomyces aquaticus TaxID=1231657 RepID=A0A1Y2A2K6_9PLEO|nr:hypothetical protein BCR34DRAFT_475840 [Clohesyomyces aquaticus]